MLRWMAEALESFDGQVNRDGEGMSVGVCPGGLVPERPGRQKR